MIRFAILLAVSTVHAACSAEPPTGNSTAAGNVNIAAGREAYRGTESTMTATQIVISSDRGRVTAELVDNQATRALLRMLPLTIDMRDHLRQEKTGNLPSPLPGVLRQTEFSAGTLGLLGRRRPRNLLPERTGSGTGPQRPWARQGCRYLRSPRTCDGPD